MLFLCIHIYDILKIFPLQYSYLTILCLLKTSYYPTPSSINSLLHYENPKLKPGAVQCCGLFYICPMVLCSFLSILFDLYQCLSFSETILFSVGYESGKLSGRNRFVKHTSIAILTKVHLFSYPIRKFCSFL